MIVCNVKAFECILDIDISGEPDEIYAEVCEIINAVLQTMDDITQQKIKNKLRNQGTWQIMDLLIKYDKLYQNLQ